MDEKRLERVEQQLGESARDLSVLKDWRTRTDSEIELQKAERQRVNTVLQTHLGELERLHDDVDELAETVDHHSNLLIAADLPQLSLRVRTLQDAAIEQQATQSRNDKSSDRLWQIVSGVLIVLITTLVMWYVGLHRHNEPPPPERPSLGVTP